jgi:CheY-like chemotaxis protein
MAHGIVTRHGGVVTVESALGEGTTVNVLLPAVHVQTDHGDRAGHDQPLTGPQRVLVVDDEPMVRQVVAEYLATDGHEVEQASNGLDALEKFRARSFDAVITDRAMPDMNGDQLAVAIKRILPDTPIILLTGFGDMMHAGAEHPVGVDVIVSKPPTLAAVRQGLMDAFKHKHAA